MKISSDSSEDVSTIEKAKGTCESNDDCEVVEYSEDNGFQLFKNVSVYKNSAVVDDTEAVYCRNDSVLKPTA